jgi:hypothetical protein
VDDESTEGLICMDDNADVNERKKRKRRAHEQVFVRVRVHP